MQPIATTFPFEPILNSDGTVKKSFRIFQAHLVTLLYCSPTGQMSYLPFFNQPCANFLVFAPDIPHYTVCGATFGPFDYEDPNQLMVRVDYVEYKDASPTTVPVVSAADYIAECKADGTWVDHPTLTSGQSNPEPTMNDNLSAPTPEHAAAVEAVRAILDPIRGMERMCIYDTVKAATDILAAIQAGTIPGYGSAQPTDIPPPPQEPAPSLMHCPLCGVVAKEYALHELVDLCYCIACNRITISHPDGFDVYTLKQRRAPDGALIEHV